MYKKSDPKRKYGIRKVAVGVVSVAIATILMGMPISSANAKEVTSVNQQQKVNVKYVNVDIDNLIKEDKENIQYKKISGNKLEKADTFVIVYKKEEKNKLPNTGVTNSSNYLLGAGLLLVVYKLNKKSKKIMTVLLLTTGLSVSAVATSQEDIISVIKDKITINENVVEPEIEGYEYVGYIPKNLIKETSPLYKYVKDSLENKELKKDLKDTTLIKQNKKVEVGKKDVHKEIRRENITEYNTTEEQDSTLNVGERRLKEGYEGKQGYTEREYEIYTVDGTKVGEKATGVERVVAPVDRVYLVGTKDVITTETRIEITSTPRPQPTILWDRNTDFGTDRIVKGRDGSVKKEITTRTVNSIEEQPTEHIIETIEPIADIIYKGAKKITTNTETIEVPQPADITIYDYENLATGDENIDTTTEQGHTGEKQITKETITYADATESEQPETRITREETTREAKATVITKRAVRKEITTEEKTEAYKTIYEDDPEMPFGTTAEKTPGVNGTKERTITKTITTDNKGERTETTTTNWTYKTGQQTVNRIIKKGTKEVVEYKETTVTERIPYKTTYVEDEEAEYNPNDPETNGTDGSIVYTVRTKYINGKAVEVARSQREINEPTNTEVRRGVRRLAIAGDNRENPQEAYRKLSDTLAITELADFKTTNTTTYNKAVEALNKNNDFINKLKEITLIGKLNKEYRNVRTGERIAEAENNTPVNTFERRLSNAAEENKDHIIYNIDNNSWKTETVNIANQGEIANNGVNTSKNTITNVSEEINDSIKFYRYELEEDINMNLGEYRVDYTNARKTVLEVKKYKLSGNVLESTGKKARTYNAYDFANNTYEDSITNQGSPVKIYYGTKTLPQKEQTEPANITETIERPVEKTYTIIDDRADEEVINTENEGRDGSITYRIDEYSKYENDDTYIVNKTEENRIEPETKRITVNIKNYKIEEIALEETEREKHIVPTITLVDNENEVGEVKAIVPTHEYEVWKIYKYQPDKSVDEWVEIKREPKVDENKNQIYVDNTEKTDERVVEIKVLRIVEKEIENEGSVTENEASNNGEETAGEVNNKEETPQAQPTTETNLKNTREEAPKEEKNTTTYTDENGKTKKVLWVSGITPPKQSDFTKETVNGYVDYLAKFKEGNGWFDSNKRLDNREGLSDETQCFSAVATNMLYWWMEQNKLEINKYIEYLEKHNKFVGVEENTVRDLRYLFKSQGTQQNSVMYNMFVNYFKGRTKGYQTDLLLDFFLNGYTPKGSGTNDDTWVEDFEKDTRAGFFYDVFGTKKLTQRMHSGNLQSFTRTIKEALNKNQVIGLEHKTANINVNHIITVWGAEFDENENLVAIYI